jgi:hypothetical protein
VAAAGDERHVLDLAAGTGQVTGQLIPLGLTVTAVEPGQRLRASSRRALIPASADVRDMYTDVSLRAQQRGIDSTRDVTLPSADFAGVEETTFSTSQALAVADVVAWFRTHSTYLSADEKTKTAMEDRAARVLHEISLVSTPLRRLS